MTDDPSAKICFFCGRSCAGEPRGKDPHGRYYHKACFEERRRAPVAPPPPPAGGACPSCGAAMVAGAVLCTSCGYDAKTGGQLQVAVVADEPRRPRVAIWPIPIGVLCILFGLGSLGAVAIELVDATTRLSGLRSGVAIVVVGVRGMVALYLIIGGSQMLLRNPLGAENLRRWAVIKIVLVLLCGGVGFAVFLALGGVGQELGLSTGLALLVLGALTAYGLFWPIFILLWLGRDTVRQDITAWWASRHRT